MLIRKKTSFFFNFSFQYILSFVFCSFVSFFVLFSHVVYLPSFWVVSFFYILFLRMCLVCIRFRLFITFIYITVKRAERCRSSNCCYFSRSLCMKKKVCKFILMLIYSTLRLCMSCWWLLFRKKILVFDWSRRERMRGGRIGFCCFRCYLAYGFFLLLSFRFVLLFSSLSVFLFFFIVTFHISWRFI